VIELLGFDLSKVLVDLDLPLTQKICLGKMFDQVVDTVVSVIGLSDHVRSKVSHSVRIFCKVLWKCGLVATRGHEVNVLSSLGQVEERKLNFPRSKLLVVSSLEILSNGNVVPSNVSSDRILLHPQKFCVASILVPENFLNLIRSRVV